MTKKNPNQPQDNQSLNQGQHAHINQVLDNFLNDWNKKITRDPNAPHNLENAVNELRQKLLGSAGGQAGDDRFKDDNNDQTAK